jgi:hypothetical protein
MTNRITVADMIRQMQAMPQDAFVTIRGSDETYDGYSHPQVTIDADGEVVISEAPEPEGYEDSEYDLGSLLQAKLFA